MSGQTTGYPTRGVEMERDSISGKTRVELYADAGLPPNGAYQIICVAHDRRASWDGRAYCHVIGGSVCEPDDDGWIDVNPKPADDDLRIAYCTPGTCQDPRCDNYRGK